jgi:arginyl-tRNA synthetase
MLHSFIQQQIAAALHSIGAPEGTEAIFELPRQEGHGHVATTVAMTLAKSLKQNPRALAQAIVDALPNSIEHVQSIDIAGPGFINITFASSAFHQLLQGMFAEGDAFGRSTVGNGKSVNVEYVSANPTGLLHAGHGRNCAVGDTLANMYQWCGYDVTREYYFNNAGNQMNKLGESIMVRVQQLFGDTSVTFPEDGYHGEYIQTIAASIVENHTNIASQLKGDDLRDYCRKQGEEWCFAAIKKTLTTLNIHHDVFFNEDSLYSEGKVEQTIADLRSKGLVYEEDGATWLALTKLDQPVDKVIVKSSGEPTYRLPDIAYHREKLLRGYDEIVDIFGADHIATIPDVLAGVRALGFDTSKVRVVIHQMVTFLENGEVVKLSKRSGKSFTLDDLIDEVGADVVRFFFVMRAVGTHLEFDLGLAKEEGDKNPVFYLQYAHARICSIIRKATDAGITVNGDADVSVLTHPTELTLIGLLARFRSTLERACSNVEAHGVCDYLRDVAAAYHAFYHDCRILGAGAPYEEARLYLAEVTRRALKNGLSILGVTAPEQM